MKKIIRHTKFKSNPFGDGGDKRSKQILELLGNTELSVVDEKFDLLPMSVFRRIKYTLQAFVFVWQNISYKEIRSINRYWNCIKTIALSH